MIVTIAKFAFHIVQWVGGREWVRFQQLTLKTAPPLDGVVIVIHYGSFTLYKWGTEFLCTPLQDI